MIYILDDDARVRDSLRHLLESERFAAREFASGEDFLGAQRTDDGGCLIVDVHMPGMSGLDVIEELRRRGDPLPAIVITGRPSPAAAGRALAAGAAAILPKPFAGDELLGLIRRCLSGKACSPAR